MRATGATGILFGSHAIAFGREPLFEPSTAYKVVAKVQTKDGHASVPAKISEVLELLTTGNGHVAPTEADVAENRSLIFTYTSPDKHGKDSGFVIRKAFFARRHRRDRVAARRRATQAVLRARSHTERRRLSTDIHLAFPETKLAWAEDGSYRAAADISVTGAIRGDDCSASPNFTSSIDVVGRVVDPNDRKVLRFEITPKEPSHPVAAKCEDVSLTMQLPVATLLRGPSLTPVTVGQSTPVKAELVLETLRANVDGTMKLVREPLTR